MRRFFNSFIQIKRKPKLVLSFDGGGVRAIASIVFLKQLQVTFLIVLQSMNESNQVLFDLLLDE